MPLLWHARRPESLRRSKVKPLWNDPSSLREALTSSGDIVHLELEDGVPLDGKEAARHIFREVLASPDLGAKEVWVRINHWDTGMTMRDLEAVAPGRPNVVVLSKTHGVEDLERLGAAVGVLEQRHGIPHGEIRIGSVIERLAALQAIEDIARVARMSALVFGVNDLSDEVGYRPSAEPAGGVETVYIRSRMVVAARLAGIDCFNAFPFPLDEKGVEIEAEFAARLGFDGMSVRSISHAAAVNRAFSPSDRQLAWARSILAEPRSEPRGGQSSELLRARRFLDRAGAAGAPS